MPLRQKRMETKDIIYKWIFEKRELKMARRRKVMKVKTRKGTERKGCNSTAANKKDTACIKEKGEQTALSANHTVVLMNVCQFLKMPSTEVSSHRMEEKTVCEHLMICM